MRVRQGNRRGKQSEANIKCTDVIVVLTYILFVSGTNGACT